jgi:HEAT repeat protein
LLEVEGAVGDRAAIALGKIGKAALPELAIGLKHGEKIVRQRALPGLKPLGFDAVPCLFENTKSKHDDVRLATIYALAELGMRDRDSTVAFVNALIDSVRAVRRQASTA